MITKILGKIGLPIIVKYLGKALGALNNDSARQAGILLGDVDSAIQSRQISLRN